MGSKSPSTPSTSMGPAVTSRMDWSAGSPDLSPSASSSGCNSSGVSSSPPSVASSRTGFCATSAEIMSFNSSRFNCSKLTICTSPGVRICFCEIRTCSRGESEPITSPILTPRRASQDPKFTGSHACHHGQTRYNRAFPMRYLPAHAQHIGARHYQQDSLGLADPEDQAFLAHGGYLAVLCDGMGGMEHGDIASQTAVRATLDAYALKTPEESIPAALERSAREANERVIEAALNLGLKEGVGTTLVAAVLHAGGLYFISVGDSAVFHVRAGQVHMVNRPHVFANLLDQAAARGDISHSEAAQHPERESLTSFIGIHTLEEI